MESTAVATPSTPATFVLVFTDVLVDEIATQGKSFKWIRPSCSCGCLKVWGHGYRSRFVANFAEALLLKRFRCPRCRKVFTLLPEGFCRRYQTAGTEMGRALAARFAHRGWPRGFPRQRAGHWMRKFLCRCRMDHPADDPAVVLRRLLLDGIHFLV